MKIQNIFLGFVFIASCVCNISFVSAFDSESFAENFYNEIHNNRTEKTYDKAVLRTAELTGLPGNIVKKIQNNSLENDQKFLSEYCGTGAELTNNSSCVQDLKDSFYFELQLAQMESSLETGLQANEIWANGTMVDSPFDLVVDLNEIDVIIFGSTAQIPFVQFSSDSPGNNNFTSPVADVQTTETSHTSDPIQNSPNPIEAPQLNSDNTSTKNTNNNLNNNLVTNTSNALAKIIPESQNNALLYCPNPRVVYFISNDNSSFAPESWGTLNNTNKDPLYVGQNNDEESLNTYNNRNLWDTKKNWPKLKPFNPQEPCLYGGNFCVNDYAKVRHDTVETDNCDPLSGICKKCFVENDLISWCFTWEFQKSDRGLIASRWVEASVSSYLQTAYDIFSDLNKNNLLEPSKETNQAGITTHSWSLTRDLGIIVSVQSKIPDQETHEPKQFVFSYESLQEKYKNFFQSTTEDVYSSNIRLQTSNLAAGSAQEQQEKDLEAYRKTAVQNSTAQTSQFDAAQLYSQNIKNNLQYFNRTIDTGFNKPLGKYPFLSVEKVGNLTCK